MCIPHRLKHPAQRPLTTQAQGEAKVVRKYRPATFRPTDAFSASLPFLPPLGPVMALRLLLAAAFATPATTAPPLRVTADPVHRLGALELQRYLHLSTSSGFISSEVSVGGQRDAQQALLGPGVALTTAAAWTDRLPVLLPVASSSAVRLDALSQRLRRGTDDHALLPVTLASGHPGLIVLGATDRAVLMGAYSLIERLTPVRFRLHGDVLPDRTTGTLPTLAALFDNAHRSLSAASPSGVLFTPGGVSVR